jgi:hypothetical protein
MVLRGQRYLAQKDAAANISSPTGRVLEEKAARPQGLISTSERVRQARRGSLKPTDTPGGTT